MGQCYIYTTYIILEIRPVSAHLILEIFVLSRLPDGLPLRPDMISILPPSVHICPDK